MTEVRSLRLHDLPFVYRLAGHGVSFDAQLNLTVGDDSLRQALLTTAGRTQVYILREAEGSGLGQLHFLAGATCARLAYISPSLEDGASEGLWLTLLDGLAIMAGQRGIVSIIAEADPRAEEFTLLRRGGFATYTRQELMVRHPSSVSTATSCALRLAREEDHPAILNFYRSLVPSLINNVEPPPTLADLLFLLDTPRGISALAAIYEGQHAVLVEIYLSADVRPAPASFTAALLAEVRADRRPVYCRVRDYMGGLTPVLEEAGFILLGEQSVMFRHTAARAVSQMTSLAEKVEGGVPQPTSISRQ